MVFSLKNKKTKKEKGEGKGNEIKIQEFGYLLTFLSSFYVNHYDKKKKMKILNYNIVPECMYLEIQGQNKSGKSVKIIFTIVNSSDNDWILYLGRGKLEPKLISPINNGVVGKEIEDYIFESL